MVGVGFRGNFFADGWKGKLFLSISTESLIIGAWCSPLNLPTWVLVSWVSKKGNFKVSQISFQSQ